MPPGSHSDCSRLQDQNHLALTVSDIQRSFAFYERLFGVTRGWPATDAGTGIHMDLPDGYISVNSVAEKKGVITHFAVAVDHMDRVAAKQLPLTKSTASFRTPKQRDAYQAIPAGSTVNLGYRRLLRTNLVERRALNGQRRDARNRCGAPLSYICDTVARIPSVPLSCYCSPMSCLDRRTRFEGFSWLPRPPIAAAAGRRDCARRGGYHGGADRERIVVTAS